MQWIQVAQLAIVAMLTFAPLLANAQLRPNTYDLCTKAGLNCDPQNNTVFGFITTIVQWILGITLGVAVLYLIYGGFRYVTSGGNETSAEVGRKTVMNAIIGIVIIILSYVIVNVVANFVLGSAGAGTGAP